ncbi:MAG: uroporphyrinogen decarboxylase family protein [Anaerolineae bacterium]
MTNSPVPTSAMSRRERLMATLRGEAVDRSAVSFYELNGLDETSDDDPYNIYNHPSWEPLIALARERTDRIVMRGMRLTDGPRALGHLGAERVTTEANGSRYETQTLRTPVRVLTGRTRRDRDVNTVWVTEHLLKDVDDLRAVLSLPAPEPGVSVEVSPILEAEAALGDTGIVMIDTPDPLCLGAELFDMATYTVMALTEPALFTALLERFYAVLLPQVEATAAALPGRLWRIVGPEFATPPFLPPRLFREYVNRYDAALIAAIQHHGGYARLHCHGRIGAVLDAIAEMGPDALDPIEPPPQGDVSLGDVRQRYGRQMVLFGNLEVSEIESLPTDQFRERVHRALAEGSAGSGRGFVLLPSSCPYGRELSALTLRNYAAMVEAVEHQ